MVDPNSQSKLQELPYLVPDGHVTVCKGVGYIVGHLITKEKI
jgi:hypothetical protein